MVLLKFMLKQFKYGEMTHTIKDKSIVLLDVKMGV